MRRGRSLLYSLRRPKAKEKSKEAAVCRFFYTLSCYFIGKLKYVSG